MKKGIWYIGSLLLLGACSADGMEVESFMHVHGLEFDRENPEILYAATHHGLMEIEEGEWQHVGEEDVRHDLMGFTMTEDNRMLSSGHPAEASSLPDPLGMMESTDQGESWEQTSLEAEVDFHVFDLNRGEEEVQYGINAADGEMMRTDDGGNSWDTAEMENMMLDYPDIFTLISNPDEPDVLLAGVQDGIHRSEDGGDSWEMIKDDGTIVSAAAAHDRLYAYMLDEEGSRLSVSEDFGETWEALPLELEEDAVTQIAVDPENEDRIAGGSGGENVYLSEDGGETWTTLAEAGEPIPQD
ncbi:F510_1955 family glycosylhydrolase [Alkalicoccus chagannorensis]|uniref:F510_1955 family glycosylhydrolase n=1 Tax=Alkalicoccus chagannorensis TaxID=427072 RepID=UPI0004270FDA|nr:YCF48-related protein [Alkalicoccus chagannorensis]